MAEVGGLYLDTDVLVFSDKVFELPSPTVPTQHKVGAYRLNGGLLRMEPESAYLQSLIQDTLEWAPKLERLPLKDQAFGFLGPAALTRTFLNQIPNNGEKITILEPNAVEGPSPTLNCSESLAIHFTGRAWKQKWRSDGLRHESSYPECLRSFLEKQCPRQYFDEKKGGEGGS